jgi:hypothetical protein
MATTTKPQRSVALVGPGRIRITQGNAVAEYTIAEVPTEIGGRGFLVENHTNLESYQTRLDGNHSECSCLGFYRWGFRKPCRHISALEVLTRLGKL